MPQLRVAVDALLRTRDLPPAAATQLLEATARRLRYHQRRNAAARSAHRRSTRRQLRTHGLRLRDAVRCTPNTS